jgi:tetratricopeptide (TPR) repeat protein
VPRSVQDQAVPHMVAAVAAYGALALGPAEPAGAGPAALLGCHLVREILGTAGAPDWFAALIADPDDEDALAALGSAVGDALAERPDVQARVVERLTAFHEREFAAGTAHALTDLGGLLWYLDDLDGAQAAYERAAAAGDPRALLDLGQLLASGRLDDDGAAALLRQAADAGNPDVAAEALVELGSLLGWTRRDAAPAREAYQRAIDSGHPHWGYAATMGLADLLERGGGDRESAVAAYRQVIATAPAGWAARASVALGSALEQLGDRAGAAAAYRRVIGSDVAPWAGHALVKLADLLEWQGDLDGVRAARAMALAAGNPEAPHALVAIGRLLDDRGDADGARAAFREAIDEGLSWADDLREELSFVAEPWRALTVEGAGQVPPRFDIRNWAATGAGVLEHGLPALPEPLSYHMLIPVASWTAARCAVVLFLRFAQHGERITPLGVMAKFARDAGRWTAHEHMHGIGFGPDPVARPGDLRGFGGNFMTVSGGSTARAPAAGHPAAIAIGRARPEVRQLALTQGGREDRRPLESHFGAWVVCVEEATPFEVCGLDENGVVLGRIEEPGRRG